jgi:hypothetical protein
MREPKVCENLLIISWAGLEAERLAFGQWGCAPLVTGDEGGSYTDSNKILLRACVLLEDHIPRGFRTYEHVKALLANGCEKAESSTSRCHLSDSEKKDKLAAVQNVVSVFQGRAKDLLSANWPSVVAVANELLARKRISYNKARAIVKPVHK